MNSAEDKELRQTLRRCSEATIGAALEYRRSGSAHCVLPVVVGILERYVDPELRPKLQAAPSDLRLIEDLALDSLTMMEIIIVVEEVLEVTVSNEEARSLRTVGDIRQFVAGRPSSAAA